MQAPAPSSTPVIQNRRRMEAPVTVAAARHVEPTIVTSGDGSAVAAPTLTTLPAHLVANAHRQTSQDMNALRSKLAALYSPEQFEPTPINPNHQLSMHENARLDSSPPIQTKKSPNQTRHERSDSLELEKVFTMEPSKPKPSKNGTIDDLSNQLSNMSFSVGDIAAIQDEGNLSSLFDDSMKLPKERSSSSGESAANNRASAGSAGSRSKSQMPMNMSSLGVADMSMSTFGGDSMGNLQSMNMSTTSFTHVFEESHTNDK